MLIKTEHHSAPPPQIGKMKMINSISCLVKEWKNGHLRSCCWKCQLRAVSVEGSVTKSIKKF